MEDRRYSIHNDPAFLLGILYTTVFAAFCIGLMVLSLPAGNKELISQLVPVMSMIQGGIIQYFYTKAQQQQRQSTDQTISKLADAAATTATTAAVALNSQPLVQGEEKKNGGT